MRAQVDLVYLLVSLFVVVIALFAADKIWTGLTSSAPFQNLTNATSQGQLAVKQTQTSINIRNDAVVFIYIFAAVASMVAGAFTDSAAVFAVVGVIVLPIELLFSFVFHDAFFEITSNSFLSGIVAAYPATMTLFQYLPLITFSLGLVMLIVVFVKP